MTRRPLSHLGLMPRLMVGTGLFVLAAVTLFGWVLDGRSRRTYVDDRGRALTVRAQWTASLLEDKVAGLARDALLLASLPTVRAVVSDEGGDRDRARRQLEAALEALMTATPDLASVRLVADDGRILAARVRDDATRRPLPANQPADTTAQEVLANTGHLTAGAVFLSRIARWAGTRPDSAPPRVIVAGTPVFDDDGERFGAVQLALDLGPWIDATQGNAPPGVDAWVANDAGDDLGPTGRVRDPPSVLSWLVAGMAADTLADNGRWDILEAPAGIMYTARARATLGGLPEAPVIVIAYALPRSVLSERLAPLRRAIVLGSLAWALLLATAGWFILVWALAPLRRLQVVAERIGAGDYDAALTGRAGGELGAFTSAFRSMVSQIRAREEENRRGAGALRESEARFRATLNDMQEGCQIIGFDWRYLYVNESAARHGRRSGAELVGRTMMEAFPGIDETPLFAALRECMVDRTPRQMENEFQYGDGTSAWFTLTIHPSPEGIFVTSVDITARKRHEAELAAAAEDARRERDRAEALLQVVPDAVILVDPAGSIAEVNRQAEALFGYAREELIGEPFELLVPERLHESVRALRARITADPAVVTIGMEDGILGRRKDGGEFRVGASLGPLSTPEGWAVVATVRDVTGKWAANRRILSQVEHLTMLDQITRAIGERHDLASIYNVVAARIETDLGVELCGVCRYDEVAHALTVTALGPGARGLVPAPLVEGDVLEVVENGLARVARGQVVHEREITGIPLVFTRRLAAAGLRSLAMAPLRSESRVFGALVAARRDPQGFTSVECEFLRQIAEHVALGANQAQLHGALQEAYDDLRQSQQTVTQLERLRAMSEMASGVAHDINNALSPVLLYAELLLAQETGLSERAREYLTRVQHAIRSVAETVSRIREFSRPHERGRTPVPVDLNELLHQSLAFTQARWGDIALRQGVTIEAVERPAGDLPPVLGVDNEIRDALTNLILNAADAMSGGGTLTVLTRRLSDANGGGRPMAVIEVTDTGVGMDEATVRRCMEPFFTTKGDRGTGLGLAMVYGTMQRHGGRMEIESRPGAGTTVRLYFPAETATAIAEIPATVPGEPTGALRLLVVDDDIVLLRSLEEVLSVDGHVVTAAGGGDAGLAAFRAALERGEPYDAVLTDLGMPKVDGRQVAAGVKALSPATPVILLTGWGRRLVAENDIPAHVDRVVSKPPTREDLHGVLAQLTARNRTSGGAG